MRPVELLADPEDRWFRSVKVFTANDLRPQRIRQNIEEHGLTSPLTNVSSILGHQLLPVVKLSREPLGALGRLEVLQ